MKKIIITAVLISSFAGVSAQTLSHGVTLLEHKTWTTGGASGHIEDGGSINSFSLAVATARADAASARVNQHITLSSFHSGGMENKSDRVQVYEVIFKLCAESNKCVYDSRTYRVIPNGSYFRSAKGVLDTSFSLPGNYDLVASTVVSGDVTAIDSGHATITVSK